MKTILGTTVVIGLIVVFSVSNPFSAPKKKLKLDPTIKVINLTAEPYLDTIVNVGAKMLEIKNVVIVVAELSEEQIQDNEYLLAYVKDMHTYYLIKIKPGLHRDLNAECVIHELIHNRQMYTNRLVELSYGIYYDGFVYPWSYPYYKRPWEEVAYKLEIPLKIEVLNEINNPLP